ncbi:hypothetical protein CSKR_101027 [Clonorchis sinensis]|uniref:Uncharacterized protein n=1 Tax=Clonorchis sinensis TaxID=79923 RepID=A0A3R7F7V9_CLOSI|nr:hypothetical protein CSKR_101027 [Clonorchis sinensis]
MHISVTNLKGKVERGQLRLIPLDVTFTRLHELAYNALRRVKKLWGHLCFTNTAIVPDGPQNQRQLSDEETQPLLVGGSNNWGERAQWLERKFADRKVRGSNPTSTSRLSLFGLGQPGSILALLLPFDGMAVRHRKGATAEQQLEDSPLMICTSSTDSESPVRISRYQVTKCMWWGEIPQRLERERTDRKVRGSNPASASRLPLSRLGQPGSIPALVLPSGGMAARHRKGATAERMYAILRSRNHKVRLLGGENRVNRRGTFRPIQYRGYESAKVTDREREERFP